MGKVKTIKYAVKCFATGDVLEESKDGLCYKSAALLAQMETIVRNEKIKDYGFPTPEACAAAVAACEYVVTPHALL